MATKANEISAYTGNAALAGGNAGGEVYNFDEANKAYNQLAYLNMQKNMAVWQQKIRDRDDSMAAIAKGELQVNNALPGDREQVQGMIGQAKELWLKHHGDLKSDPNVWINFNDQLSKVRDASLMAQSRLKSYQDGMAEAAKELNPIIKQKMLDWYNKEKDKPLKEPFLPYQQTMNWSGDKIKLPLDSTEEVVGRSADGLYKTVRSKINLQSSYNKYLGAYKYGSTNTSPIRNASQKVLPNGQVVNEDAPNAVDDTVLNVEEYLKAFYGKDGVMQPGGVGTLLKHYNDEIDKIAVENGYDLTKKDKLPAYLQHMDVQVMPDGHLESHGTKWDDWFRLQMVDQYNTATRTVYDEEAAKAVKAKDEHNLSREKQLTEASKRGVNASAVRLNDARVAHMDKPKEQADADYRNVFKTFVEGVEQGWSITDNKGGKRSENIVPASILPEGYQYIGGVDNKGQAVQMFPIEHKGEDGNPDNKYKPGYVPEFLDKNTGQLVEVRQGKNKEYSNGYEATKTAMANSKDKRHKDAAQRFTYDDYIRGLVERGRIRFRLKGRTADGREASADANSIYQALSAISNKAGAPKEEVFTNPDLGYPSEQTAAQ